MAAGEPESCYFYANDLPSCCPRVRPQMGRSAGRYARWVETISRARGDMALGEDE